MVTLLDLLPARLTPAARFKIWIEANRHVYDLFKTFAAEVRDAGHTRYSARAILHRIRWHFDVITRPPAGDEFKINDHVTPYLARMLIEEDASFRDFFELRKVISEID